MAADDYTIDIDWIVPVRQVIAVLALDGLFQLVGPYFHVVSPVKAATVVHSSR